MDTREQHFVSWPIAEPFAITIYNILDVDSRLLYYLGNNTVPRAILINFKTSMLSHGNCLPASDCKTIARAK
jgi:hypothetical protein